MAGFIEDQERKLAAMQAATDLAEQRRLQSEAQAEILAAQQRERNQTEVNRKAEIARQKTETAKRNWEIAKTLYENSPFPALLLRLQAMHNKKRELEQSSVGYFWVYEGDQVDDPNIPSSSFVIEAGTEKYHLYNYKSIIDRAKVSLNPDREHYREKIGFYLEIRADGAVIGHGRGEPIITSISGVEQNTVLAEDILGTLYTHPKTLRITVIPPEPDYRGMSSPNND